MLQLFRGFLVGLAGLLPGLCGSTLLVLFHIYRPLTAALAHPFTDFRKNLLPFFPFFLAAGIGILVGSRLLATIFARHEIPMLYLFMGFMLGALPDLFRHAHRAKGRPADWIAFAAMLALCLAMTVMQNRLPTRGTSLEASTTVWVLAGAGIGLGSIIPGASVAFLLIYFDIYQPLLDGVSRLQPAILLPVILGAALAILLFSRAADWLFRRAEAAATRGVLGLVVGSILLVYPGWPPTQGGICLSLLLLGLLLSAFLNKLAPPPD